MIRPVESERTTALVACARWIVIFEDRGGELTEARIGTLVDRFGVDIVQDTLRALAAAEIDEANQLARLAR